MIIQNGTIEFKTKTGGGIDPETGYPVKPSSELWGEPVPCQFRATKYNQLSIIKGEHVTLASYEIYNPQIEMFAHFKTKSSFHKTKRII